MRTLWLFAVRTYISIGFFFYFKKIEVKKQSKIAKDVPVLFVANHQNALLDPLIIAVTSGRYAHFLTRAQVFKKPLVSKVLKSLQLIPVFRVRDGWNNLTQNNAIFTHCVNLLNNNDVVTIFPEGSHNKNRTVRPLSKGFTRIVFELFEKNPYSKLQIIPVGLNYNSMLDCPDSALVNYGEPIDASRYNLGDKHEATKLLKADIHKAISTLTTHIKSDVYEENLAKLESKNVNFLQPEAVNACLNSNFETCNFKPKVKQNIISAFFRIILIVICFVPYLVWKKIAQPKIKEIEFTSTFRFALAVTLVPFWLLIITLVLGLVFSGFVGLCFLFLALIITVLTVKL